MDLYFLRHGKAADVDGSAVLDDFSRPLTRRGIEELEAEADALRRLGVKFDLVLTSPLQRALETCRLAGYGERAQVRPDLVEWNYGRYEGLTSQQIEEIHPNWSLWRDGGAGGETAPDVGRRADRVIAEVRATEGDALIFAHGHVLRVLAARWLGEPPEGGRYYALQTATLSVLSYEHADPVIQRWNLPPSS